MKFFVFLQISLLFFFVGCSSEPTTADSEKAVPPVAKNYFFSLKPNDMAYSDSVAANLATGVKVFVAPQSSYTLSFEIQGDEIPELQLFRIYEKDGRSGIRLARSLKGEQNGSRVSYSFNCEENSSTIWVTSLAMKGEHYADTIKNVSLEGEGMYPESFDLNLVIAGEYTYTSDSLSEDELAKKIKSAFSKYYKIQIDTIYVSHASEHPVYGRNFSPNRPYVVEDLTDEIQTYFTEWGDVRDAALDLVLVHRMESENMLGFSPVFGMSMSKNGYSVVLATHVTVGASAVQNSSEIVVNTAVHESGHFFGLRHTTATHADAYSVMDASIWDDGIPDTEWCPSIALKKVGTSASATDVFNRRIWTALGVSFECPDSDNIMYPYENDEGDVAFSKMQLEIVKKNLTLLER